MSDNEKPIELKPWMEGRYNGKHYVFPPRGSFDAPLMILAYSPSKEDQMTKELMSRTGEPGAELINAIDAAGLRRDEVYMTSIVKEVYYTAKPPAALIEKYTPEVLEEIALVKPKLIMTLGAEAYKWLVKGNKKMGKYMGEIIPCTHNCMLLPNWSPGMILGLDPTLRPQFQHIVEIARRYIRDELKKDSFEYVRVSDVELAKTIVKHYVDTECFDVGYDAEWLPGKYLDQEVLHTVQISCTKHKAVVFDIFHNGQSEDRELLDTLKPLLEHPKVRRMGWNIRADDKRLIYRGFQLPAETLAFDGMKAVAFLDSRRRKGLETGIEYYTNLEHYYVDFHLALEQYKIPSDQLVTARNVCEEEFFRYCGGDAVSHREACLNMMEEMKQLPKNVQDYYYQVYLPLSSYLADLEMTGIPVDIEVLQDLTQRYTDKYQQLKSQLAELVKEFGFDGLAYQTLYDSFIAAGDTKKKALSQVRAAGLYAEFNANSYIHKKILVFDRLKLEPTYYKKPKKQNPMPAAAWQRLRPKAKAQYSPSTNNKALASIRFNLSRELHNNPTDEELKKKYRIIATLLNISRVGVFATKFLNQQGTQFSENELESAVEELGTEEILEEGDEEEAADPLKSSYWNALCSDGRIHADFFECLSNFRSSSRPNVQNPASKVLSHIPDIFVPGYSQMSTEDKKKNGEAIPRNFRHCLWSGGGDWLLAEIDVASADLIIAAYLSNDKDYIHDMLAGGFHLKKAREYFQDPAITKDDYSKYVSAKSITFRVAYTAELEVAALPIQAEVYAESGILIPEDRLLYALGTWRNYQNYMEYRTRCIDEVKDSRRITNARGIPYLFEDSNKPGILAGWYNESLAYPIASELALFLWEVCVKIKKRCLQDQVWMKWCFPVNTVHDALYFLIHKDLLKDKYFTELCKHYFTKECKIVTGHNLGMEMVVSDRWKAKEAVFQGETRWDAVNRSWVWK